MELKSLTCPFCNSKDFECAVKEKYFLCSCKSCKMKWMESKTQEIEIKA